jgi:hypothetical protein
MAQTKVKLVSNGVITVDNLHTNHGITTDHVGEGSLLYYSDSRVQSFLTANNYVTQESIPTVSQFLTSLNLTGSTLSYVDEDNITTNIDLSSLGYLTSFTETDPIYVASSWYTTTNNAANWDTAFGWGNHASAGYLTSFTESDPVFTASAASGITSTNISNWNTAYGWGDHASQGYATQTYVNTAVAGLVDAAPATLDTLNELAAALGDDPNFATTVSTSIGTKWTQDNTKISNWDTAYGWGNHASAGYLTSFTESDPTVPAHVKSITTTNISNWNTAYGWGNHASAGYLTSLPSHTHAWSQITSIPSLWYQSGAWLGDLGSNGFTRESGLSMTGGSEFVVLSKAGRGYTLVDGGYFAYEANTAGEAGGFWSSYNSIYGNACGFSASDTDLVTFRQADGGSIGVIATSNMRAPIFYDSNDTGYYLDPAGTSVLSEIADNLGNRYTSRRHSGSDFPNGTLVQTNIPATGWAGNSFVLEATGKSYSTAPPFSFMAQGYLYADTIINYSGIHFSLPAFSQMKIFQYNGNLCFWWPRWGYWNSFDVCVRNADGSSVNRVTSITDSTEPTGTKKVTVNMQQVAVYDNNWSAGRALYAGSYYDGNNTNYYVNPDGSSVLAGSLTVSNNNATGGGIILADDGDIVDLNDAYCSMRFSYGVRVFSANRGGSAVHTLHSNGTFTASGDVVAYSDARVKENIEPIKNALEKTLNLKGVYYNRTDKEDKSRKVGVIAQEIIEFLPEVVTEDDQGMLGVSYGNITAVLIEAIKEQQQQIDELKSLLNK